MPMSESAEHKRLVKALMNELVRQGFEILNVACEGYEPCPEIAGVFPDVRAYKRNTEYIVIGLAKTLDDFDNKRTEDQFEKFSHLVVNSGKNKGKTVPFFIAITKGSEKQLDTCLIKLGFAKRTNIYRWPF